MGWVKSEATEEERESNKDKRKDGDEEKRNEIERGGEDGLESIGKTLYRTGQLAEERQSFMSGFRIARGGVPTRGFSDPGTANSIIKGR